MCKHCQGISAGVKEAWLVAPKMSQGYFTDVHEGFKALSKMVQACIQGCLNGVSKCKDASLYFISDTIYSDQVHQESNKDASK